jgi:RNA polymerase sigma-70 factor (ECF subfamily)
MTRPLRADASTPSSILNHGTGYAIGSGEAVGKGTGARRLHPAGPPHQDSVMETDVGRLFEMYHESLVRMLHRRTGDRDRAEDLAQETFARAVAAPPLNPRPWLFAVALNLVREDGRRAVRQGRRLQLLKAESEQSAPSPEEELDLNDRKAAVRAALAELNDRDREALLLKAEGFNYDEIAETLGLARGAIGTTLARARKRLVEAYRTGETRRHAAS